MLSMKVHAWIVADHYIIVQRWRPFFLINAEKVNKVVCGSESLGYLLNSAMIGSWGGLVQHSGPY